MHNSLINFAPIIVHHIFNNHKEIVTDPFIPNLTNYAPSNASNQIFLDNGVAYVPFEHLSKIPIRKSIESMKRNYYTPLLENDGDERRWKSNRVSVSPTLEPLKLASSFSRIRLDATPLLEILLDPSNESRTLAISLIGLTNCHSRLEEEEATFTTPLLRNRQLRLAHWNRSCPK